MRIPQFIAEIKCDQHWHEYASRMNYLNGWYFSCISRFRDFANSQLRHSLKTFFDNYNDIQVTTLDQLTADKNGLHLKFKISTQY